MNQELLKTISVWIVWYEDRFHVGDERPPAYMVAFFASKEEAEQYIDRNGERLDSSAGVFAGMTVEEWTAFDVLRLNVIPKTDLQKVLRI